MSITQALDTAMALETLDHWLRENGYERRARDGVADCVRRTGAIADAIPEYLDREDEETASAVFEEAFPALPGPHPDWQDESVYLDVDSIVEAFERASQRLDGPTPDAPDWEVTQRPGYAASLAADGITLEPAESVRPLSDAFEPFDPSGPALPPISGGAIDPRDDEPAYTDAEWDEMHADSREWPPSGGLD